MPATVVSASIKSIRICHFSSVHTIDDTRVFHRECVTLAKQYHTVLIAIGSFTGMREGVHIQGIAKPKSRIIRFLTVTWRVFFRALRVQADIYHIHDAELLPFGLILCLLGKKVIYDIHENTVEDIRHKPWIPTWLKSILARMYYVLEWISSRFMHFIIVAANPGLTAHFSKRKGHYTIIQNFARLADTLPYRGGPKQNLHENNMLYMGTIQDMYYDFDTLTRAIMHLLSWNIPVHLHVVGYAKPYLDTVWKKHPNREVLEKHIHFHGFQPTVFAYQLAKECKIGLCLKNQPPEILVSHERKFFEYLALGLPVLTCNASIYSQLIDAYGCGRYTDLSNAQHIAVAIREMLTTDNLNAMQQAATQAADNSLNWELEEQKLLALYAGLI